MDILVILKNCFIHHNKAKVCVQNMERMHYKLIHEMEKQNY